MNSRISRDTNIAKIADTQRVNDHMQEALLHLRFVGRKGATSPEAGSSKEEHVSAMKAADGQLFSDLPTNFRTRGSARSKQYSMVPARTSHKNADYIAAIQDRPRSSSGRPTFVSPEKPLAITWDANAHKKANKTAESRYKALFSAAEEADKPLEIHSPPEDSRRKQVEEARQKRLKGKIVQTKNARRITDVPPKPKTEGKVKAVPRCYECVHVSLNVKGETEQKLLRERAKIIGSRPFR
jgi:hypothetical protein